MIGEAIADEEKNEPDRSDIESDSGVITEGRGHDYAGEEGHGDIAGVRRPRHLVCELCFFFFRERGAEFLLGTQDDEPGPECPKGADAGDIDEKLGWHDIVQTDSEKQDRRGEEDTDPRQTMTVQRLEAGRCIPLQRQVIEHTSGTEDPAVAGREYRRDDDDIDDIRCASDAEFFKGHNKRGAHMPDLIPWVDGHDDAQREYIENQDTPEDFVDGFLDGGLRIMRFARRR